jgi:ATP-binding protein involved in chromosome partitioning
MAELSEREVLQALSRVNDPGRGADVVGLGMISGLAIRDGHVSFAIEVAPERGRHLEELRRAAEKAVDALPGVISVTAVLTAERAAAAPPRPGPRPGPAQAPREAMLPEVRHIVAVASGKGGVGKSTTAVNLAVGLARLGLKIGILDADIYGPSLPRMLGLKGRPHTDGKRLLPMQAHGLICMSIGFLVPEDTPTIWRGPMVMGALEQMLRDVIWGALDVMVVDMPPGTGDAQLTMAQRVPLAGAVIVSTPQDIALIDARKGLNMFRRVDVPVLGLVENMSYFLCPHCGGRSDIFGHGGARRTAEELGMAFLGEVPLHISIRETSDAGTPIVSDRPASAEAQAYMAIAEAVAARLGAGPAKPAPKIVAC